MKKRSICIFLAGMISLYSEAGISAPVWAEPGITAEAAGTEDADVLDETTITSDDDTLEDAVDSQTEALVRSLTDQFSQLAGEITSYDAYTANVDKVKAFYDTVVTETSHVLLMMRKDSLAYVRALMASGESSDEIYEDLDDINDYIYEDGCEDLSDAVYDQLFEDISDAFYDGVLEDSDAAPDVASWSDVHSSEFNMWSHARSDVYDAISDCSSDIFDFTHHVERDLSNDDPDKASERINGFAADTQELEDRLNGTSDISAPVEALEPSAVTDDYHTLGKAASSQEKALFSDLTARSRKLTDAITSYAEYAANAGKVEEFYDYVLAETQKTIILMYEDSYNYADALLHSGKNRDDIYNNLDYIVEYIHNGGCGDMERDICDGLLDDMMGAFFDGVLSDMSHITDFDSYEKTVSHEFDIVSGCRSDVSKAIYDCESDIFEFAGALERAVFDENMDQAGNRAEELHKKIEKLKAGLNGGKEESTDPGAESGLSQGQWL